MCVIVCVKRERMIEIVPNHSSIHANACLCPNKSMSLITCNTTKHLFHKMQTLCNNNFTTMYS